MKRVIVVGSGIAGLIAAMELSHSHAVTLVTKSGLSEGNTRYAQGGIAAAMTRDDSVAMHIADTLRAGAGLSQVKPVEILCVEGPQRIRDLVRLGVAFDLRDGEFERGLEAAHTRPRVLHAGGDATGLTIETALLRALRDVPSIQVMENTFAVDVQQLNGCVAGLYILRADATKELLPADAVVLASGGAGQLYQHTTNPAVATGDGLALALRAGAAVADLEFYQFHPTLLAAPGKPFLISEAVRGEGAILLDAGGRRFMQALHVDAELAPRDVVARGIAMQMAAQQGQPVLLDATKLGREFLQKRFPVIDGACRERGLEWWAHPIPVTPAAHYWMGGVHTDQAGRTSVRGLYAVGEVAHTGVHGANRLASNSLLESLVFAWRCAHLLQLESPTAFDWPAMPQALTLPRPASSAGTKAVHRAELQQLMWQHAGIQRDAEGLQSAITQLDHWHSHAGSMEAFETSNLLTLARALCTAALLRQESRGAHNRSDYPEPDPTLAHSNVFVLAAEEE